ncbi:uncharacterized protein N7484_003156 [Penicillium longicatenatum]|uniref:uncharacterized protein n=1 Tax=Penicillium longicatenatum TaxID=1561947 RepID=UPI00254981EF|nr:uncharacterized protein N7484_003156 [Penicillium longicatenatum]KAJ5649433.1 hypothetical protein N7484_003156 [Penicillium longicatenatum]
MKLSNYGPLALIVLSAEVSAYLPAHGWRIAAGTGTSAAISLANKYMGNKAGVIVASQAGATHLVDCIDTCWTAGSTKTREDAKTCAISVITTAGSFALAYNNFQQTGSWSKREDGLGHIDEYLSQIEDHISLTDIHYEGMPLNHTHLPESLGKRDISESGFHALHNSSMPLSFVYHNKKANHVPLLVSTNGTHHHIGHLQPVDETNTTISSTRMSRRSRNDFNPSYTHIGKGGVKVQCNSKYATMTHDQVEEFMDGRLSSSNGKTGLDVFRDIANYANFAGFSFSEWIIDGRKNYLSGQWAMEGETNGFGSNWETNWDWCFGVDQTSCEKDL